MIAVPELLEAIHAVGYEATWDPAMFAEGRDEVIITSSTGEHRIRTSMLQELHAAPAGSFAERLARTVGQPRSA